jgi:vitamin B12 transporter
MRSPHFRTGLPALVFLVPVLASAQPIRLDDIVVSANRTPTEAARTGSQVSVLTAADLAATGATFVSDALARLPGFHFQQSGGPGQQSGFAIRGVPQGYVRIIVDGIEVSDPSAPGAAPASLSGLTIADIDRIEVLRGSQSALYGGQAVGGVISITTTRATRDGYTVSARAEAGSYGTAAGSLSLASRGERGDFALTLQGYRTDGFSAADENDGNTEDDGYSSTRLTASGSFQATDALRLFGSAFAQDEDGDYDGFPPPAFTLADTDDTFELRSYGARAGAELTAGSLTHTVSAAWFDTDRKFYAPDGSLSFGGEGDRAALEYLGTLDISPDIGLQFGADYARDRATYQTSDVSADDWIGGVYALGSWSPAETVTLTAALRHDRHSEFGGETTGRVTAAWSLRPGTILRASAGTGFRAPSLDELYGPFGSNPDLTPETSVSYDLGIEQALPGGRGSISAAVFRLEIDDLITYDFACTVSPFGCYDQVTDGKARSEGVELAARFALTDRLTLSAAYTYTDSQQPNDVGGTTRRSRVPRNDLNLALDGNLTDALSFGVSLRRVTGTVESGTPLDDYTLVDARIGYALDDRASVYLRAENLFDEQYQTARGYGTADRSFYFGIASSF